MYHDVNTSKKLLEERLDRISEYWYNVKFCKLSKVQKRMIFRGNPTTRVERWKVSHNEIWRNYEDSVLCVPMLEVLDTVDIGNDARSSNWVEINGFYHLIDFPMTGNTRAVRASELVDTYKNPTTKKHYTEENMAAIYEHLYERKNCEVIPIEYQYTQPRNGHFKTPRNHMVFTAGDSIVPINAESLALIWKMTGQQEIALYLSRQVDYIRQEWTNHDLVIVNNKNYAIGAFDPIDDIVHRDNAKEYLSSTQK